MELRHYAAVLIRYWWAIILVAIISGAASLVISLQMPRIYEASTTFVVARRSGTDFTTLRDVELLTRTYVELLRKRPVIEGAITRLNLNMTPDDLLRNIAVATTRDTLLITLSVRHPDPQLAADIANAMVQVAAEEARTLLGNDPTATRSTLEVVELAIPTPDPVSPRILTNVLVGIALGGMVGFGLVLVLAYLNRTIQAPAALEDLTHLPIMAAIPRHSGRTHQSLVTHTDLSSPIAEAYRMLRARIDFASSEQPIRTLMITSPETQTGKSTVAANLATVIAQSGQHVILVDANLRQPALHTIFQLSNQTGLAGLLTTPQARLEEVLQTTSVAGLRVLTAGTVQGNAADLLETQRLTDLTQQLTTLADVVIFDSPTATNFVDAVVIGRACDATLIIAGMGQTRTNELQRLILHFEGLGLRVIGLVLNRLSMRGLRGLSLNPPARRAPVASPVDMPRRESLPTQAKG